MLIIKKLCTQTPRYTYGWILLNGPHCPKCDRQYWNWHVLVTVGSSPTVAYGCYSPMCTYTCTNVWPLCSCYHVPHIATTKILVQSS